MGMLSHSLYATRTRPLSHSPVGLLLSFTCSSSTFVLHFLCLYHQSPTSNGHTTILTVVDQFSKMAHLIPSSQTSIHQRDCHNGPRACFWLNDLPNDIVSDRDLHSVHIHIFERILILKSVNRYHSAANKHCKVSPTYKVGRSVQPSALHLPLRMERRKLVPSFIWLFTIIKLYKHRGVQQNISCTMMFNRTFQVSRVKPPRKGYRGGMFLDSSPVYCKTSFN